MATVGRLNAILSLSTARFETGVKRAKQLLGSLGGGIMSVLKRIFSLGGALVGVAGVGGLGLLYKRTADNIDATAKLAVSLGLTTEALVGLQYAANISGVSAAELETAFRRMEKTIGDAKVGLSTAVRALEALGLTAKELDALAPDEQFRLIAERLKGVATQSEKARIAQDLFGRSGMTLIPLLNEGADGMAALAEVAKRMGLVFDAEAAAKVEMANDAMTNLNKTITGGVQQAVIQLAPYVEVLVKKITELAMSGDGVAGKMRGVFEFLATGWGIMIDIVNLVKAAYLTVLAGVQKVMQGVAYAMDFVIDRIQNLAELVGMSLPESIRKASDALKHDLGEDAAKSFEAANKAADAFLARNMSAQVGAWLNSVDAAADKLAKEMVAKAMMDKSTTTMAEGDDPARSFLQITKSRTAFGPTGMIRRTPITADPEELQLLREIKDGVRGGAFARAS